MLLKQISGIARALSYSALKDDPLWSRDVSLVSSMDIQLFYARSGLAGLKKEAHELVDQAQAAVITAAFKGLIQAPSAPLILHEIPQEPYMVDELVDGLSRLSTERRSACLFALESKITPEAAADLCWSHVVQIPQATSLAAEILAKAASTRHIRLPYVFWEWATETIAAPLIELRWSIAEAFCCPWPRLAANYRDMIQVNRNEESASFLELARSFGRPDSRKNNQ